MKLPRLDVEIRIEGAENVLGNFPSSVRPQSLLRYRERHEGPARSLLDQVRDPFCGNHACPKPNAIAIAMHNNFGRHAKAG